MKSILAAALVVLATQAAFPQRDIATLSNISKIQAIGDKVFFTASHDTYGAELFVSEGEIGTYRLVRDINPGMAGSTPGEFTVLNGELFFTAYSVAHGLSVWKSDGTTEGTTVVYSASYADPFNLMVFKGKVYFTTNLGSIMRTDGTASGTEVFYQSESTYGRIATVIKSERYIYFTSGGRTIYRDDGTSRINFYGPLSWEDVYFRNLFVIEDKLVAIKSGSNDNIIRIYAIDEDLLRDGGDDEWPLIRKLDAPIYGGQEIGDFTSVEGKLFFSFRTAFDNVEATDELWVCDGTEAGTKMLKSFGWDRYYNKSGMGMFFAFNGKLFFRGGMRVNRALWSSDGTAEGTIKYHDVILTPPFNDERTPVTVTEDKFYFSGGDGNVAALWSSNGTPGGTQKIMDPEDDGGGPPHDFSFSNDVLYFVTSQQFSSTLWSSVPAPDICVSVPGGNAIRSGTKPYLFYGVPKGTCNTVDLNIINKGLQSLYLSNLFITGNDFYVVQRSLPEVLAPGESVTIQLVFNPISEKISYGTLSILSNDSNESKYMIELEATPAPTGTAPLCQFQPGYVKSLRPGSLPRPVELSNYAIAEGQPQGTVIGTFSQPANATFELVAGEGDADNQQFVIEGDLLKSKAVFNFNVKNLYSLRVKARSPAGDTEESFRISITNASFGFTGGACDLTFERMSFSYTGLVANQQGHLFAATSNGKILRSKDLGGHWEVVYSGYDTPLSGITFKGNTGYACGNAMLLKSEDGGATWFRVYIPFKGDYYFDEPGVFFFNEMKGYVGTEAGEIFYTTDGGRTWETRLAGGWDEFRSVFFVSENKGFAIVEYGDLYQTIDGGRSWKAIDLSGLGWNTRIQDVLFLDEQHGFLIGDYKVYATSDGGKKWVEQQGVSGGYMTRIKFFNKNLGFMYGVNGVIYKTANGGATWETILPGIWPAQVTGIAQTAGKLFIAAKDYYDQDAARTFAVSSDEGVTWTMLNGFTSETIYNINFSSEGKGIAQAQYGIFSTEDNGLTWKQMETDLTPVDDIVFIDDNNVIIVSGGHIYKSTDGGRTTRRVLTTEQGEVYAPAGKLYSFPGDVLFSMSWHAMYRSDDAGETWTKVATDPGYYTQGLHFISATIGYRVELFGSVQKSIDGGKTWTEIFTRDPDASNAFNAIFFLNENLGYKGGAFLQRTSDGGVTWETIDWPLPEIFAINFDSEEHGYVVMRSGAVYETKDKAVTWKHIYSAPVQLADVRFNAGNIFLAGAKGFVARMNATPRVPSLPGYIYGPDHVCSGEAVEFYVAVNYNDNTQWSTTAGNMEDHNDHITVNFPDAGEYTITAKHFNQCGNSESRTTTVKVSGPANAPVIEGPVSVFPGELDVEYTVINGTVNSYYLWDVKGSASVSPVDNAVVIDWAQTPTDGTIKVLKVDAFGCRSYGTLVVAFDSPLAVESELLDHVSIYPNPSETDTKINSSHEEVLYVRIVDALGREYSRTVLYGNEEQVMKTRQLPAGMYFVEISDGTRTVTRKLIRK